MPEVPGKPSPAVTSGDKSSLRRLVIVLVFAPALWLGLLMYAYGVDTPYWDEWDEIPGDLVKLHDGTFGWSDLMAQHNEHRIPFPRIILLATAWLTSWNTRAELLVIWLLACLCSFSLWRLSRATGDGRSNADLALLAVANILLFTPVAFENWLWGFQVQFLLALAAVAAALWLVTVSRTVPAFVFAIALSVVCTFSMASGFLCWFVTLPLLVIRDGRPQWRDRVPGLVCFFAVFAGSVILYLYHYIPASTGNPWSAFSKPDEAILYVLTYLGSGFGWEITALAIIGTGVLWLFLFTAALLYLARHRSDSGLIQQTLPWVMLSSYALLNGIVIMLGRLDFGANQATAPRYITFAVMLPIGLLFIYRKIYLHWRQGTVSLPQIQVVWFVLFSALAWGLGSNLYTAYGIIDNWKSWRSSRLASRALVEFALVTKNEELTNGMHLTYGNFDRLREDVRQMGKLGYLRPAPVTDPAISAFADIQAKPSPEGGFFDSIIQRLDGKYYAYGWAVFPDQERPADVVLLTYQDKAHPEPVIFDVALVGYQRDDVAQHTQQDEYQSSGWLGALTPDRLPPGPHLIRAWAYDFEENRAYPLMNGFEFDAAHPAATDPNTH
jgi:hypothetical protein